VADNTTLPGTGDVIAADDVGGVKYQIVKPAFGALDTATLVTTGAGLPVAPQYTEQASLTAGSLNADLVASTDVSAYRWMSLHINGTYSGTLSFQASNDNSNWLNFPLVDLQGFTGTSKSALASVGGLWTGPTNFRYLRVRMTAYSSGTATGVLELSAVPSSYSFLPVSLNQNSNNAGNTVDTELPAAATLADGASNPGAPMIAADAMTFNGATWDRHRGNVDATILASAARTTTQTGSDITNYNARGIKVVLDTTVASTGSVTLKIQGKDSVSGAYYDILTGAAVTNVSTNVYTIYPGATAVGNTTVNDSLPRVWRVVVTANNSNSQTYSVGSCVLL